MMRFNLLYFRCVFVLLLCVMNIVVANASEDEDYLEGVARIEKYLNGISVLVADFTQVADAGEVSTGVFYLSRPGKLRWQYFPPNPTLIIANGSVITYYDRELDEVSNIHVEDGLSSFLTRRVIAFDKGVQVVHFERDKGFYSISLVRQGADDEGQLTMVFEEKNKKLVLKQMDVLDVLGKTTTVMFENVRYDVSIDKSLFYVTNLKKRK